MCRWCSSWCRNSSLPESLAWIVVTADLLGAPTAAPVPPDSGVRAGLRCLVDGADDPAQGVRDLGIRETQGEQAVRGVVSIAVCVSIAMSPVIFAVDFNREARMRAVEVKGPDVGRYLAPPNGLPAS